MDTKFCTKHCKRCETTKSIDDFYDNNSVKSGKRPICRSCDNEIRTLRRQGKVTRVKKSPGLTQVLYQDKDVTIFLGTTRGPTPIAIAIDTCQWGRVKGYCWCLDTGGYPSACIDGRTKTLHLFLYGTHPNPFCWDHIDRNPLNNRSNNLRVATRAQNLFNKEKGNQTGIYQITLKCGEDRWIAQVGHRFKRRFKTKEEAIRARDTEGYKLYKDFYIPCSNV